jgi:hypothetical protein
MVTQEYTYAYGAVSVIDLDSLILPHVNGDMMQIFLDKGASRHPKDRIIMILDGAGWHTSGLLSIPRNMRLVPPAPRAGAQSDGTRPGRIAGEILSQPGVRKHRYVGKPLGSIAGTYGG